MSIEEYMLDAGMDVDMTKKIDPKQAYEWVKTGHWSFSEFEDWADTVRQDAYDDGYKNGYDSASDYFSGWD